jgi:hypothetical protein
MKETIDQIRGLLSDLESEAHRSEQAAEYRGLSGLELPDIMRDVVDLLLPELSPYEAAFYFYLLRHSIIENGAPFVRVSRRGLQEGVIKSGRNQDGNTISYATSRQTLNGLEVIGAIRQEAEPNRDGTLYRVLLPEEIDVCKARRALQRKVEPVPASEKDIDYYNVRENRMKIYERDNYRCVYCGKQLTRFTATLDHVTPVREGGDNSAENLRTACLQCNSRKTSRPLGDFLAELPERDHSS